MDIVPIEGLYSCTRPSNLLVLIAESTTTTELPTIYAKPESTVNANVPPSTGVNDIAEIDVVLYLSPDKPVGPISPVGPVYPV